MIHPMLLTFANNARLKTEETATEAIDEPITTQEITKKRNWADEGDEDGDAISDSELRRFEAGTTAFKTINFLLPSATPVNTPLPHSLSKVPRPQQSIPLPQTSSQPAQPENPARLNPRKDFKLSTNHSHYKGNENVGDIDVFCTACQQPVTLSFFKSGDEEMSLDWDNHLENDCKSKSDENHRGHAPYRQGRGGRGGRVRPGNVHSGRLGKSISWGRGRT